MKDNRPWWQIKRDGLERYLTWLGVLRANQDILVPEFPRSGGTWFCQMLSEISGCPFPRNTRITNNRSILHAHYPYNHRFYKPIHIIRDGRDVMISAYHYFLLNEDIPAPTRTWWRKKMNVSVPEEVSDNLTRFIHIFHHHFRVAFRRVRWGDYVLSYLESDNVLTIRYEDLLSKPRESMEKATQWLEISATKNQIESAVHKYEFTRQTGRKRGASAPSKFMRKGISGDWENYFTKESSEVFDYYSGNALIQSGYEENGDWIPKR